MKKGKGVFRILTPLAFVLLLISCKSTNSISGRNLSHLYKPSKGQTIRIEEKVIHLSSNQCRVNLSIDPGSMVQSDVGDFQFSIRYRLYESYSSPKPIDSGQVVLNLVPSESTKKLQAIFECDLPSSRNYMLDVTIVDLVGLNRERLYMDIINPERFSDQSFNLFSSDGNMRHSLHLTQADTYRLQTSKGHSQLFAKYYQRQFPVAAPPFSAINNKPFEFRPDKTLHLLAQDSHEFVLPIAGTGFYQISPDSNERTGGSVFYFGAHFPKAKTVNDLFFPLRYITTSPEYYGLSKHENKKQAIDEYWLKLGGSTDRARMLIKAYYSRVEQANILFSSYLEGWKTDRGMCYIVFGPPSSVYRTTAAETWYYGEQGRYNSLSLTFTKVVNPFSNNDFRLNRNASLKSPWYRAVEFWRQGRVITYE